MGKKMGGGLNKAKTPKVGSMGKGKGSEAIGKKGGIHNAGLPAPKVGSMRGAKGDER